jgi:hypothetical protein
MKRPSRSEGITSRAAFESTYLSGVYRAGNKIGFLQTRKRIWPKIPFFLIALSCIGCTCLPLESDEKTGLTLQTKERMTLILNHTVSKKDGGWLSSPEAQTLEQRIHSTVKDAFSGSGLPLQIVSPQEFRRMVFPALGFEVAPHSPEYLALLLKHPAFMEKIKSIGIRYLVVVSGQESEYQHIWGDIWCGAALGGGGGGCAGLKIWKKDCYFRALILDTKQPSGSREVTSEASGYAWLAVIDFPIGLPAFSESKARQALGEELVRFFESLMKRDPQKAAVH